MKRNIKKTQLTLVGLFVATAAVFSSCQDNFDKEIKKMSEWSSQISYDDLPADMKTEITNRELFTYLVVYPEQIGDQKLKEKMNSLDRSLVHSVEYHTTAAGLKQMFIVMSKDHETMSQIEKSAMLEDEVFTLVDEQPTYPGGITAFYEYIGAEISYPKTARDDGVGGRVFVQFIVEKTGEISNVKVVKGVHPDLDAEAKRVVENSSNFIPGKQNGKEVAVRMVLPVQFILPENKSTGPTTIKIEKIDN